MVDKIYAMSSFLQFRTVVDPEIRFSEKIGLPLKEKFCEKRTPTNTSDELYNHIENYIKQETADGKAALALSGGIDSIICAKFMPKGSVAYTFKCIVPNLFCRY